MANTAPTHDSAHQNASIGGENPRYAALPNTADGAEIFRYAPRSVTSLNVLIVVYCLLTVLLEDAAEIFPYAPRAKDVLRVVRRLISVSLAFPRPKGSFVVAVDEIIGSICVSALLGSWLRLILGQAYKAGISSAPAAGAEILRSSAPVDEAEGEAEISSAPEAEILRSSAPADEAEGEAEISSAPEAEILRSSTAEGEAEISCAPEAEILQSFAPTDVAEILLSEIHRSSAAEGEAEISSAPEAEILRSSTAEGEAEISCAPEAEIVRSFTPMDVAEILLSEIHRSSVVEGEAEISSAPEAEILRSSAAEGETEILLPATQLDSATSAGADRTQQINLVVAMIGVLATFMSMVLALCSSYKDPSHIVRDLRFVVVSMLFTTIICLMVASKLRQLVVVGVVMSGADLLLTMALVYLVISE